ncbi:TerD family protein [Rhodococcus sp. BP-252]|uniref:3'-5' exonuclease n=1 Tax=Rhodococcoides kyotonense TaxID=398843 RepID=A0A177Y8C3_9NOCA|nr:MULTISPECIES: TerD family protein [Rhodococcus]MBY6414280.1 TerD family protein [Rhodococcus sp. BP-320]MBY6419067.1 TerD family protein [Rhodococcus sp. BP-321]MBY6423747.1 TerD family protein [Rhodococcus sp. BP-324]MBY6429101.1 TerD family protein [Rhodococcus sp. BP-323]MBY6434107.1 TerD family protein [Rhodococcus sp. BP-322]
MGKAVATDNDKWIVVDVETSGLKAGRDRVLSVAALTVDEHGRVGQELSTLVNPGCDPGPVHIHKLTPERLAGAPSFEDIAPRLMELLDGRTMVAHNASFDHGFLKLEAMRAGLNLPTKQRLCTVALSRRLQLDLPNHKLATLAAHWKVLQSNAHDAYDDARVLAQIFTHSSRLARSLDLPLPVVKCTERLTLYPDSIPRTNCEWENPGPVGADGVLVQGMRVVISGDTRIPRLQLAAQLTAAGLDVMNSVSRYTSVVVCSDPTSDSRKVERARAHGLPVISEERVVELLRSVTPGTRKGERSAPSVMVAPSKPTTASKPWQSKRVLVVGGSHAESVLMRSRLIQLGATPAVNLSAGVTDVLVLAGGDGDPRMPRVVERGLPLLTQVLVDGALDLDEPSPPSSPRPTIAPLVPRGGVVDIAPDVSSLTVNSSWHASDSSPIGVDVVAFLLNGDELVSSDEDFVFYNAPATSEGSVALTIDGDSEQGVRIDLSVVPSECERIVVAAAIEGERTFGDVGAVSVSLEGPETALATAVLDAATTERTLLLAEIYRRNGAWRFRAVGQGYDDGLAELAVRYGVEVDD